MANLPEFREFFLRHTQVVSGSKPDTEIGFPLTYVKDGKKVFNRFLKGDYPTESVFTKLFNSIVFWKNPEDSMTTLRAGHGKLASDAQTTAGVGKDSNNFTLLPQVHQIPKLVGFAESEEVTDSGTRKVYTFSNTAIISSIVNAGASNGSTGVDVQLRSVLIPVGYLNKNGAVIKVNAHLTNGGLAANPTFKFVLAKTPNTSNTESGVIQITTSSIDGTTITQSLVNLTIVRKTTTQISIVTEIENFNNSGVLVSKTIARTTSTYLNNFDTDYFYIQLFGNSATSLNALADEFTVESILKT